MMGTALIENDMTDHHQQLLALSSKPTRERMLTRNVYESFSHPLPELPLSRPELVIVRTHDPSGLLCSSFGWR